MHALKQAVSATVKQITNAAIFGTTTTPVALVRASRAGERAVGSCPTNLTHTQAIFAAPMLGIGAVARAHTLGAIDIRPAVIAHTRAVFAITMHATGATLLATVLARPADVAPTRRDSLVAVSSGHLEALSVSTARTRAASARAIRAERAVEADALWVATRIVPAKPVAGAALGARRHLARCASVAVLACAARLILP